MSYIVWYAVIDMCVYDAYVTVWEKKFIFMHMKVFCCDINIKVLCCPSPPGMY